MSQEMKDKMDKACADGNLEVVQSILDSHPDSVGWRFGDFQETPLHIACWKGQTETVKVLLSNKANLEAKDEFQQTPLHIACSRGHTETVKLLLSNNANLEAKDKNQWTPLHLTCWYGPTETVKLLLSNKENLEAKDKELFQEVRTQNIKG